MGFSWIIVIIAGFLNGVGAFLLKKSLTVTDVSTLIGVPLSVYFFSAILLFVLNLLLLTYSLNNLQVSVAYPVFVGLSQAVLAFTAFVFLGERLGGGQYFGITIIIIGVVLLGTQPSKT